MASAATSVGPDTLVAIKVTIGSEFRRFKLPLKELVPYLLPTRLHTLLRLRSSQELVLERYSDSAAKYVVLDSKNTQVYKQLYRAAKAKLKLRIRAQIIDHEQPAPAVDAVKQEPQESEEAELLRLQEEMAKPPTNLQKFLEKKQASAAAEAEPAREEPTAEEPARNPTVPAEPSTAKPSEAPKAPVPQLSVGLFTVCCNICSADIPGAHWHCGICEDGDYDLCANCVDLGSHCGVDSHFLIKRMIENGRVINSSVERIPRKIRPAASADTLAVPFVAQTNLVDATTASAQMEKPKETSRTCNSCVLAMNGKEFVTCDDCDDYDLCFSCHRDNRHGHHPAHSFSPVDKNANMSALATALCKAGRNAQHMALCDGCDKNIRGVRSKCLNCPDWDFCSTCVKNAATTHPGHRFVPIYESLPLPNNHRSIHFGVRCDGPLCSRNSHMRYISGVRFKCAVCHDLDFCANCEAHPSNTHNRTHPMIQMKTAVESLSVTTHEETSGQSATFGDRQSSRTASTTTESRSTETAAPPANANASTQVQTVAESKPLERAAAEPSVVEVESQSGLDAHFERDVIPDGTKMPAGYIFTQVWTLRNPGPASWPVGCCLRYVGGDRMLNIDTQNPASVADLDRAVTSNVLSHAVAPGANVSFAVKLKAPERLGKSISYWRVKTSDGQAFGHKLWCDIEVTAKADAVAAIRQHPGLLAHRFAAKKDGEAAQTEADAMARGRAAMARRWMAIRQEREQQEKIKTQRFQAATNDELSSKATEIRRLSVAVEGLQKDLEAARKEKEGAVQEAQTAMARERANLMERLERLERLDGGSNPDAAAELAVRQSQMIFPTLDKESPQVSVYENAPTEQPREEAKAAAEQAKESANDTINCVILAEDEELIDDVDSLTGVEDVPSSDDEGFLTDEEYEILDSEFDELSQAAN